LERSLSTPDRIVGELLQPGGMQALNVMGLTWCTEGIDAIPAKGYCVVYEGKQVQIPYPSGAEGRSFHHGAFVMHLREAARRARGVDVIEATVNELIECPHTGRVLGVRATPKWPNSRERSSPESFFAEITFAADGCYSKFRSSLGNRNRAPVTKSQFFGAILEHAPLPIKHHGTVALIPGSGPVLMYQIGQRETRMLVDVKLPLPPDVKGHIKNVVVPSLPLPLQPCVLESLQKDRLRSMPNSFLPATMQGQSDSKEGLILIGDAWNMRHPLTGGGMTVALNDVVLLTRILSDFMQVSPDYKEGSSSTSISVDWEQMSDRLKSWHWSRKGLASTVNILSIALYDLFGADDAKLSILREGCFAYFECGGDCVNGPVSLLAGLAPSPLLLAYHFFAVALYSIYLLFTAPPQTGSACSDAKSAVPNFVQYPALTVRSMSVLWTACVVFGPLVWTEVRWW